MIHHPILRVLFGRTFDRHDVIALITQLAIIALSAWLALVWNYLDP